MQARKPGANKVKSLIWMSSVEYDYHSSLFIYTFQSRNTWNLKPNKITTYFPQELMFGRLFFMVPKLTRGLIKKSPCISYKGPKYCFLFFSFGGVP
jgi:hypothetical protein